MTARLDIHRVDAPDGWVDDGATRPIERWGVLAVRPDLLAALERYGSAVATDPQLRARHRSLARLVVTRRSEYEHALARERARTDGLGADEFEAVADENWADECFDDSDKIVFRFAAIFDAGHGVPTVILDELRRHLADEQVIELCLVCAHYGGLTRLAIALGLEHTVDGLS